MSAQRKCPSCSSPLDEAVSFCSECGAKVPPQPTPQQAPQHAKAAKHTMLGVTPEALAALTRAAASAAAGAKAAPAAPAPAPADDEALYDAGRRTDTGISEPPRGQMGRTVLGMTPPPQTLAKATAKAMEQRRGATPASGAASGSAQAKPLAKTMFGVGGAAWPASQVVRGGAAATTQAGSAASADERPAGKATQKTLFSGGPLQSTARMAAEGRSTPLLGAPVPVSQLNAAPAPTTGTRPADDLTRTRVGSADTPEAVSAAVAAGVGMGGGARNPRGSHTLLGLEDDAPAVGEVAARPASLEPGGLQLTGASASVWDQAEQGPLPRESYVKAESTLPPRAGIAPGKLLLVVVLLLAAAALALLAMLRGGPEVRVRVASEAGKDTLEFEVPGAVAGTKLRFGGIDQPLQAGRASFALGADAIRVGENVVLYDLVEPNGDVESGKITLSVDYRVTLDTAPLRAGKTAVDVVVAARPGSQVWLDGQALALDAQGRAVRSDPLELSAGKAQVEHVVRYRVQPPAAEATVGELRTQLLVARLSIDRPGPELVTDRDVVEIAGEVEPGATVSIDGHPVEVRQGRFLHRFPLPLPGELRPQVVATAEGQAPHAITLRLQRVSDLGKAAEGFVPNAAVSYVKLAQNAEIYRGQKVALEGRVYNVSVQGGHSALQVLVRSCPKGERCPLWVSYPAATDFTVDSWVRVLGTVAGEQAFVSETGEQKRVPKVQAAFLLPAKP